MGVIHKIASCIANEEKDMPRRERTERHPTEGTSERKTREQICQIKYERKLKPGWEQRATAYSQLHVRVRRTRRPKGARDTEDYVFDAGMCRLIAGQFDSIPSQKTL